MEKALAHKPQTKYSPCRHVRSVRLKKSGDKISVDNLAQMLEIEAALGLTQLFRKRLQKALDYVAGYRH